MTKAKSICFYSPKGGVGKTVLAMNVAGLLSMKKKRYF